MSKQGQIVVVCTGPTLRIPLTYKVSTTRNVTYLYDSKDVTKGNISDSLPLQKTFR